LTPAPHTVIPVLDTGIQGFVLSLLFLYLNVRNKKDQTLDSGVKRRDDEEIEIAMQLLNAGMTTH